MRRLAPFVAVLGFGLICASLGAVWAEARAHGRERARYEQTLTALGLARRNQELAVSSLAIATECTGMLATRLDTTTTR